MSMLQADRRKDPYPFTWEIPIGILTGWLLLAILGVHVGRALANLTAGAGWTWPASRALFRSLSDVLAGQPAAGLDHIPTTLASPGLVLGWIIAVQTLLIIGLAAGAVVGVRRWGPGRMKGMATAAEVEAILGVTRLRKAAPIIRPDLHRRTPTANRGAQGHHEAPQGEGNIDDRRLGRVR